MKQLLEKILPKKVTVEEIHNEFDSGEQRILDECDKILAELKIPTETQVEKKANNLLTLGFVNSETVKQAENLKAKSKEIEQKIQISKEQAEKIRYFKNKYPFDKFITEEELDRICEKYKLIHAPVANYIKDIPEKNVNEMLNRNQLSFEDAVDIFIGKESVKSKFINKYKKYFACKGKYNFVITSHYTLSFLELKEINIDTYEQDYVKYGLISKDEKTIDLKTAYDYFKNDEYRYRHEKVDKSGLFIAAPKSHFNLEGLNKKSKYGFFKTEIFEVKDPVVFEYCMGGLVKIITKWGIPGEDKAYLDPILQNEVLN